jgi:predicted O-linked N-acetylglucosamine transferase (SPINDLY family)
MASVEDQTFQRALAALRAGHVGDAEQLFKKVLATNSRHVGALNLLSVLLTQRGRFADAEKYVRRALTENSASDATLYNYGVILKALNRPAESLERFNQALAINPAAADTWNNRGTVLNALRRYVEAAADFDKAIAIDPNYAAAFCNKGKSLANLNQVDEAAVAYDRALVLQPGMAEAWIGRGNVYFARQQYADAQAAYRKALFIKPETPEALLGLANGLMHDDHYGEAMAVLDKVVNLKPDLVEAWLARIAIFLNWREYGDVIACCDKVLAIDPDCKLVPGHRLHAQQYLCDWRHCEREATRMLDMIRSGKLASAPFPLLSIASTPADQLQCAQATASAIPPVQRLWTGQVYAHDRIRIAYVSADLHEHPVGHLVAGLFEQHDRARFEVTAVSLGTDDGSNTRARLKGAVEYFIDARTKTDEEIAALIREREIDIAVDLNGYTDGGRLEVFARRPAPIQMNYLGYAGTRGAACFDYIVADRIVLPPEHVPFYSERPIWLPDSYMVTDRQQPIAEHAPTRSECGLPDAGFVFCCFNNLYKIAPATFRIWMRLLHSVEDSVLWLSDGDATAKANLRAEAQRVGVAPERLFFAPRVAALADHLARHQQADLFLDTLPYNAHATTAFALWTGLPVVTCLGTTFAGRVAGSLLAAVGLDELVTSSPEAYEAMALALACDPGMLAGIKAKLKHNRDSYPLFDTPRFTRHIESAYITAWEKYQRGEQPDSFAVAAHNVR